MTRWLVPYLDSCGSQTRPNPHQYVPHPAHGAYTVVPTIPNWCTPVVSLPHSAHWHRFSDTTPTGYTDTIATGGLSTFTAMDDNK